MGKFSAEKRAKQYARLIEAYGDVCAHCGRAHPDTIDHVIPTAAGGGSSLANLQLLCWHCNQRKANAPDPYRVGEILPTLKAEVDYVKWALKHGILQARPLHMVARKDTPA